MSADSYAAFPGPVRRGCLAANVAQRTFIRDRLRIHGSSAEGVSLSERDSVDIRVESLSCEGFREMSQVRPAFAQQVPKGI